MTKKMKKKFKIRPLRFCFFLLILTFLGGLCYFYLSLPIKNLTVIGNSLMTDNEILSLAGIDNYPSYYFINGNNIRKKLLNSPYIKKVDIKRHFFHSIELNIKENKIMFFNQVNNKYVLDNFKEIELLLKKDVPTLLNYVPDVKYHTLITKMALVNDSIRVHISEIEYVPNDYDKDRFFLYMDDSNGVYLTLTKFEKINHYLEVLKEVKGKKGIFYFDNGNHFEAIE